MKAKRLACARLSCKIVLVRRKFSREAGQKLIIYFQDLHTPNCETVQTAGLGRELVFGVCEKSHVQVDVLKSQSLTGSGSPTTPLLLPNYVTALYRHIHQRAYDDNPNGLACSGCLRCIYRSIPRKSSFSHSPSTPLMPCLHAYASAAAA